MSGRSKRLANGQLRPAVRRSRARRRRARRNAWLANFAPGARDRFFRNVVVSEAKFLAAFHAARPGLTRTEASELLEQLADAHGWMKLRTLDSLVVGIGPPKCAVRGCREAAGETHALGVVDGEEIKLRVCDPHEALLNAGTAAGVSLGDMTAVNEPAQESRTSVGRGGNEIDRRPGSLTAVCGACGRTVRLTKDGFFWRHAAAPAQFRGGACPGSGLAPQQPVTPA